MKQLPYFIIVVLILIIVFRPNKVEHVSSEVVRDTVCSVDTVRDTVRYPVREILVDSVPYPVFVRVAGDTIRDTVYLPITQKVYKDSLYTAYVSGYRAKLDSIEVYSRRQTVYVRERTKRKRWGLGMQTGYGWSENKRGVYVGVGISYNLLEW